MPKSRLDHLERNALVIPECPGPVTKKVPSQPTPHLRLDLCQPAAQSVLFIERILAINLEFRPRRAPTVPGWQRENPIFTSCFGCPCTVVLEPMCLCVRERNWMSLAVPFRFVLLIIVQSEPNVDDFVVEVDLFPLQCA